MSCGKCGKSKGLCPLSFGLALGLTSGLAVFIWSLWVMVYGMPPMMAGHVPVPTLLDAFLHALLMLVKGFVFGFFFALIYDCIICCCKCKGCKKSGECTCQLPNNRPEIR